MKLFTKSSLLGAQKHTFAFSRSFTLGVLGLSLMWVGCEGKATATGGTAPGASTEEAPGNVPVGGDFIRPTGDSNAPDACAGVRVAAPVVALQRLTVSEQSNAYRDLTADQNISPALAPAAGAIITEIEVEKTNAAVQSFVSSAVAGKRHLAYVPCDPAGAFNSTCVDTFIADFGKAAFRRPLSDAEKQSLRQDVFDTVRNNTEFSPRATFREALDAVAQVILQSPEFMYRRKEGVVDATLPAGIRRLTGYERAADLSFRLWETTPDKDLLAAAASGALDTAEGVRTQAERLLASPRAKSRVRSFVSAWLQLDGNSHQASLESAPKSATAFPFDSPVLRKAMREEVMSLYEQSFFGAGGSFKNLMTTRRAYVNKTLGQLYGVVSPPADDTTYAWVDLNAEQRAGLFTRAAFLALYAPQEQKSPIRRGVFVYRQALCQPLGDPPANVNNTPIPPSDHARTAREIFSARTSPASCQACHARINPLGFSLENYDAMGRYGTTESATYNGTVSQLPVDSTVTVVGTDFDGALDGPVALSAKLADSGLARDCVASTWFSYANARPLGAADACSMQRLMRRFRQTDDMRDLLLSVVSDESALFIQETP